MIGSCQSYFPIPDKVKWSYPLREEWVRRHSCILCHTDIKTAFATPVLLLLGIIMRHPSSPTMQNPFVINGMANKVKWHILIFKFSPSPFSWYAVPVAEGSTCWLSSPKCLIITEAAFWEWWMMGAFWKIVQTFSCRGCRNFLWHIHILHAFQLSMATILILERRSQEDQLPHYWLRFVVIQEDTGRRFSLAFWLPSQLGLVLHVQDCKFHYLNQEVTDHG